MKQILSNPFFWVPALVILASILAVIISVVSYTLTKKDQRKIKAKNITDKDIREWNDIIKY